MIGQQVGYDPFGTAVTYPVEGPQNPNVALDEDREIEATIHLQYSPLGESNTDANVGTLALNLTLVANGGEILGSQTVEEDAPIDEGWVPFEFAFPPRIDHVERGSLEAEVNADATTTGYVFGYEGDHASSIALPVSPGAPS